MEILTILISGILTDNVIFSKTLGLCPFLGVSKKVEAGASMGLAVTLVIMLSSIVCWVLNSYILIPLSLTYLQIILFILIVACLVQLLDIVLKRFAPALYHTMGIYLALITTNCAVLGTVNQIITLNLTDTIFTALATGLGFMLALILMSGIRERLQTVPVPRFFKGFSIALIAAAIMAMAFMGLKGVRF